MDVERLPSGKFETNELVLELTIIAYNLLRMIGQESLKHKPDQKKRVKRRRIRTVISNMIQLASHVTTHARKTVMALGRSNTEYKPNLIQNKAALGRGLVCHPLIVPVLSIFTNYSQW